VVDFGVDRGGQRAAVPKQLPHLGQPSAGPQHLGGQGMSHLTIYRWVQRFTPLLIDAARPCRHSPGDRWFVDEA
jgi:hypothetical protein